MRAADGCTFSGSPCGPGFNVHLESHPCLPQQPRFHLPFHALMLSAVPFSPDASNKTDAGGKEYAGDEKSSLQTPLTSIPRPWRSSLQLPVTLGAQTAPRCLTGPGCLRIAPSQVQNSGSHGAWGTVHTHPAPALGTRVHSHSPESAPGRGGLRLRVVSCWVLTSPGVGVTLPPCSQRCGGSPLTGSGSRNLPQSQDGCLSSPEPVPCHFSPLPWHVPSRMENNCELSPGEGDPMSGGSILGEWAGERCIVVLTV